MPRYLHTLGGVVEDNAVSARRASGLALGRALAEGPRTNHAQPMVDHRCSRVLLLGLLACLSCRDKPAQDRDEPAPDPRPRLVLLYATCTVNASYLSPYDAEVDFTPNLQRFASEGLVFERHTTESGQSGIAFASIFSGAQADHHQIYRHPLVMSPDVYLVSEAFAENGYDTFVWNGHPQASPELGYAQGIPEANRHKGLIEPDQGAFKEILQRLADDPSYRAFVMTNFTLTHSPYRIGPLRDFLKRYPARAQGLDIGQILELARLHTQNLNHLGFSYGHEQTVARLGLSPEQVKSLYRAISVVYSSNVHVLDRHFGRVVEAIRSAGLLDKSLVVFTADHGEVVDRENALYPWSHAMQLAPEVLRVPLIVHAPRLGVKPGVHPGVTRSIDILPTIAGLSKIELGDRSGIEGVDLSPSIQGLVPPLDLLARSHTSVLVRAVHKGMQKPISSAYYKTLAENVPDEDVRRLWVRIRQGDVVYKRRRFGDGEWQYSAFDLSNDPEERKDIFDREDPSHAEMARRLDAYWQTLIDRYGTDRAGTILLPADEEAALRALGYIE